MKWSRGALLLLLMSGCVISGCLMSGCVAAHDVDDPRFADGDDNGDDGDDSSAAVGTLLGAANTSACKRQTANSLDHLPDDLVCTGLYSDLKKKTVTSGVREYAPGLVLWSDGASKKRWIYLPKGKKIDTSDMAKWKFPVGTKLFKEFSIEKRRMETRLFEKTDDAEWSQATYVWNKTETFATRETNGVDIELSDGSWHVPTQRDCSECHEGRAERILGFEAIALGVDGATGLTLKKLVDDKLLTDKPPRTHMEIGDDGTGLAPPVLGWIHMNCGVSCHNDRPASKAYQTNLRLRLDPELMDGRPSNDFEPETTMIGAAAKVLRWQGLTRVVPGDPDNSLLYTLVTSRKGKADQMPPLASVLVDDETSGQIKQWILRMEPLPDAGVADGGDAEGAD